MRHSLRKVSPYKNSYRVSYIHNPLDTLRI